MTCTALGQWNEVTRSEWRCSLPMYKGEWSDPDVGSEHMGAPRSLDGHNIQLEPVESHCDGCPGGWYRCGFTESVARYERLMFDSGFSANVELDRTDDALVLEATRFVEIQRLRHRNHWNSKRDGS